MAEVRQWFGLRKVLIPAAAISDLQQRKRVQEAATSFEMNSVGNCEVTLIWNVVCL